MAEKKRVPPRSTPERDAKYIAMAWVYAGLSKDPSTQVGAVIIDPGNNPKGWGYNGPPANIPDDSFSWERPEKYDYIRHAEQNAIAHSDWTEGCTLYCSAMPCKKCMLDIAEAKIIRVVYYDYQALSGSSLTQNTEDRDRSLDIAHKARIQVVKFQGNLGWLPDWVMSLKDKGVFAH